MKKDFWPFEKARAYMRKMGFTSKIDWEDWCAAGFRPDYIPSLPNQTYKDTGWQNWSDFLGYKHRRSYGELCIAGFLAQNEIKYQYAVSFCDCVDKLSLPFDIGVYENNDLKLLIEFHGQQHYIAVEKWGGQSYLELLQKHDLTKEQYCVEKNISLFTISYNEIDNIYGLLIEFIQPFFKNKVLFYDGGINPLAYAEWLSFEECREYVRSLGFKGVIEFRKWARSSKRPHNVPKFPDQVYAKFGWHGYGDFLGNGNIATFNRQFVSYEECEKLARILGLSSMDEWREWVEKSSRMDLPLYPEQTYVDCGWISSFEFLGTKRNFKSFVDCLEFARSLNFKCKDDWYNWVDSRPSDVPYDPSEHYKILGWISWGHFLGFRVWLPFDEVRAYTCTLGLTSSNQWFKWYDENKPLNIPKCPNAVYKKYWLSWEHFLGYIKP